jgi:hypothetical protein
MVFPPGVKMKRRNIAGMSSALPSCFRPWRPSAPTPRTHPQPTRPIRRRRLNKTGRSTVRVPIPNNFKGISLALSGTTKPAAAGKRARDLRRYHWLGAEIWINPRSIRDSGWATASGSLAMSAARPIGSAKTTLTTDVACVLPPDHQSGRRDPEGRPRPNQLGGSQTANCRSACPSRAPAGGGRTTR